MVVSEQLMIGKWNYYPFEFKKVMGDEVLERVSLAAKHPVSYFLSASLGFAREPSTARLNDRSNTTSVNHVGT